VTALGYLEPGRTTLFGTTTIRCLDANAPFSLHNRARRGWSEANVMETPFAKRP
jgi:hypothetical protein